jgi:hypothetical protein
MWCFGERKIEWDFLEKENKGVFGIKIGWFCWGRKI